MRAARPVAAAGRRRDASPRSWPYGSRTAAACPACSLYLGARPADRRVRPRHPLRRPDARRDPRPGRAGADPGRGRPDDPLGGAYAPGVPAAVSLATVGTAVSIAVVAAGRALAARRRLAAGVPARRGARADGRRGRVLGAAAGCRCRTGCRASWRPSRGSTTRRSSSWSWRSARPAHPPGQAEHGRRAGVRAGGRRRDRAADRLVGAYALRRVALPASGLYPIAVLSLAVGAYGAAATAARQRVPRHATCARSCWATPGCRTARRPAGSPRGWPGWPRSGCSSCWACWPRRPSCPRRSCPRWSSAPCWCSSPGRCRCWSPRRASGSPGARRRSSPGRACEARCRSCLTTVR